jgi:site-specific DNA-methyltransferase (cytosine-N4-specific)
VNSTDLGKALGMSPIYRTGYGAAFLGDAEKLLARVPTGTVNLVLTSPPYALHFKKEYRNVNRDDYVQWFTLFAKQIFR